MTMEDERMSWHHPECEGECIACLIEREVQKSYGNQGLNYLLRHVAPPPASKPWVGLTQEEKIMCRSYDPEEAVDKTEAKLREKNA